MMKNIKSPKLLLIFLLLFSIVFIQCRKDDKDSTENIVKIVDNITQPTVWNSDNIYVIDKWDFYVDSELRIEPGTIIRLPENHSITVSKSGDTQGKIIAEGTPANPIIFTSIHDSEDSEQLPKARDWGRITLQGTEGSVFRYCEFYYGGLGESERGTLVLSSEASATVAYCTFAYCGGGRDGNRYFGALNASSAQNNTVINNNIFYSNTLPLSISPEISIDNSNVFSQQFHTNVYNGIFVDGISISSNTTWAATEVAFALTNVTTTIEEGAVLTLGNHVVLKFTNVSSTLELSEGTASLSNYDGEGVYFTSFRDDERKGDTNGDGGASMPNTADWEGIYDVAGDTYMSWSNILYNNESPVVK